MKTVLSEGREKTNSREFVLPLNQHPLPSSDLAVSVNYFTAHLLFAGVKGACMVYSRRSCDDQIWC